MLWLPTGALCMHALCTNHLPPAPGMQIGLFISGNPCNPLGTDIPIGYYTDVTYKSVRDWVNKILVSQGQTPV